MPAIDHLLKRLGFVRLSRYGLVLTSEGRIMSLRPAILDDGLGGRIVGWPDGDLAAMELSKWEPARPASQTAVATRVAVAPPPIPLPKPVIAAAPLEVAQPPQVDEDDWEWEIALARARVAAEEAEQAAASARAPRARLDTVPPPVAQASPPKLVVKIPPIEEKPVATIDYEDRTQVTVPTPVPKTTQVVAIPPVATAKPVVAIPPVAKARPATTPPTIIPIPKLPSIKDRASQIQPVVSTTRASRTRFAKGTGPVGNTHVGVAPPPPIRAADDDKTSPGMALPVAARTVSLPSIKRVTR